MEARRLRAEEIMQRNIMTQEELAELTDDVGELDVNQNVVDMPVWGKLFS